jgi:hypothetical protein
VLELPRAEQVDRVAEQVAHDVRGLVALAEGREPQAAELLLREGAALGEEEHEGARTSGELGVGAGPEEVVPHVEGVEEAGEPLGSCDSGGGGGGGAGQAVGISPGLV